MSVRAAADSNAVFRQCWAIEGRRSAIVAGSRGVVTSPWRFDKHACRIDFVDVNRPNTVVALVPAVRPGIRPERRGDKSAMRSSVGRVLVKVAGGLAVVAISFFATMQLLNYWLTPPDPNASVIHVVEATYGLSCKDFTPPPGHANLVKVGNATAALAQACDTAKASCMFNVDPAKVDDPATDCGKDFNASWRCGGDPLVRRVFLPAEASGRSALLSCPAP
jgi:hypothetical protein